MDIILIGGLWLDGSAWDQVVPALAEHGHRGIARTLPGQGGEVPGDRAGDATLADQVTAVVAAVDSVGAKPLVVGHSAACSLAWLAADARPDRVARVVLIGGFPTTDGGTYADLFPTEDGVVPFPGWEPFEGPDAADLDAAARQRFSAAAVAVPEKVTKGVVRLTDDRRYDVPVLLVCPEFTPDDARAWIEGGDVPELAAAQHLEFADIDSGHWPMITTPAALAAILADAADRR